MSFRVTWHLPSLKLSVEGLRTQLTCRVAGQHCRVHLSHCDGLSPVAPQPHPLAAQLLRSCSCLWIWCGIFIPCCQTKYPDPGQSDGWVQAENLEIVLSLVLSLGNNSAMGDPWHRNPCAQAFPAKMAEWNLDWLMKATWFSCCYWITTIP